MPNPEDTSEIVVFEQHDSVDPWVLYFMNKILIIQSNASVKFANLDNRICLFRNTIKKNTMPYDKKLQMQHVN